MVIEKSSILKNICSQVYIGYFEVKRNIFCYQWGESISIVRVEWIDNVYKQKRKCLLGDVRSQEEVLEMFYDLRFREMVFDV